MSGTGTGHRSRRWPSQGKVRRLLAVVTATAFAFALGGGAGAPAATTTLYGTVGPGYTITLKDAAGVAVTSLPAGTYTIVVDDQATDHNFHLSGPGVDQLTTVPAVGQVTWTVTLSAGTYQFVCDPHVPVMNGSFTVTAPADTTPPDTTITAGPSGAVNTASASFGFSSTEAGSTFQCALDAGAFAACSSPQAYSALANGSHTFQVRAIDAAGNVDPTPASRTWSVDTVAPDTTITAGPSGTASATSASFSFSSNEAGATFQCALDSTTAYGACSSPKSYSGLASGAHVFRVRAVDAAGNVDASPAGRSWTIDATPPDTTLTVAPSGTVGTPDASFEFTATKPGSTFQCSLDGEAFSACTSPDARFGLADGAHAYQVRAVDASGNVDPTPASAAWTVDTTPPETTIDSGPAAVVNSNAASFGFSSNEAGATFECSLDGAAFAACTSPQSYTALAPGAHNLHVRATDSVGNADTTPASASWTIDTTAPETTIDSGPSGTDGSTSPSFGFSSNEAGVTFQCALDGAAFSACTSPQSYSGLATGPHTFQVKAIDGAGNVDPTVASRSWTIDTSALYATDGPGYTITFTNAAGATITSLPAGTYTIVVKDRAVDHNFHLTGAGVDRTTGLAFVGEEVWTVNLTGGSYHYVCDPHAPIMFGDFTVVSSDATPPETTVDSGPSSLVNTKAASFSFSSNEAGSTFQCALDGAAFSACTSPQSYAGLADGSHTFAVKATDAAGNVDATPASRTWSVDTAPPDTTIDSGPSGTVSSGSATFAFSATEPGASFTCSLDGAAATTCSSPQSYSGLADGSHSFQVQAIDAAGNADPSPAGRSWTVSTAPPADSTPPETTIDSNPAALVSSSSATFVFSASEPGASFGCSLDGADFGPCSSPQSYSGLADGSHTFAVRATDLAGNVDATPASRSWRIDTAAPDTTITSGPTGTTASGSASFAFSASEAGSSYECALDGSAFASCSSPKSYSGLANGSHTFQVRAIDAAGNVDPTPAGSTWIVQGPTTPTLYAQVGPTATISLKDASGSRVRRLPAGAYTIVVRDLSTTQNFHLDGPGVNLRTPVRNTAEVTWTVTLRRGDYEYFSDANDDLGGEFTVGKS